MGYGLEVEMIAAAHAKDLLTTPYVFSADEAAAMAKAGADIVVCHLGLTTGGSIGAETALSWRIACRHGRCLGRGRAAGATRTYRAVHGGPIAEPDDAAFILEHCQDCHGFYGASIMERLPTEVALTEQTRKFKAIGRQRG